MRINVRFHGIEGDPLLIEHAGRKLHQHLSRFGRHVTRVTVRFSDLNGPKGGEDKRCQLTAAGPRLGQVHLAETHADVYAGLDLAIDRLARVIGRSLERAGRSPANHEARSVT